MQRIEDLALLSNLKTCALIDCHGDLKWMCAPVFSSPACFSSLLGDESNGHWLICPAIPYKIKRQYIEDTFILETEFITDKGRVKLTDFMPYEDEGLHLFRTVEGLEGEVPLKFIFSPRFHYGSLTPLIEYQESEYCVISGPDKIYLRSSIGLELDKDMLIKNCSIRKGENISFRMTWSYSHEKRKVTYEREDAFKKTLFGWQEWIKVNNLSQDSLHPQFIKRAMLTLKALTYRPTGSLVAAATTSLPEEVGGVRNWDYRYCWPRDAAMAISAVALATGRVDEVDSWRGWLQRAAAGVPEQLRTLYGLKGEMVQDDKILEWLSGFNRSRPVRIGNSANSQLQLDIYVSVVEIFCKSRRLGLPALNNEWGEVKEVLDYLEKIWHEPDEGIWEIRGKRRHFVQSKLMVWLAFKLAVDVAEQLNLDGPLNKWKKLMSDIHQDVCEKGFSLERNSFVQYYGSREVDANLLLLPLLDFLPFSDERIINTIKAVEEDLLLEEGLLMRYRSTPELEGLPYSRPKAFLLCSAWLGQCYVKLGRIDDARKVLEKLYSICNDLGLLSEQYDPVNKCLLGNFPQAFSHIALISLELSLSKAKKTP